MKRADLSRILFLPLLLTLTNPAAGQVWNQTWNDEFNGPANSAIDSTKWTFDTGNLNVNNELEIYCSPSMTTMGCDPNHPNAFVDGAGHLIIQQRLNGSTWTSARLKTQGVKTFQYGRVEANLQIPSHAGLWPAFWMLGSNIDSVGWPACGEADIMENWPGLGGNGGGLNHNATSMHGPGYSGAGGLSHSMAFPAGQDVTGFHTYGIIWSQNMVQFYFDDPGNITFVRTIDDIPAGTAWPFNNPFFLITNMAVGGDLGGTPDSGTASAAPAMAVDYIRYYQPAAIAGPTLTAGNAISLAAGSSGNTTVSLSSQQGTGLVYVGCSGAPAKATCSINTSGTLNSHVVDFRSSNTAQLSVNVSTTANTARLRTHSFFFAGLTGLGALFLLPVIPAAKPRWMRSARLVAGVFFLLLAAAAFSDCGGGAGPGNGGGGSNGTPAGQYQLTVTAITVSGDTSTTTVALNVR